MSAESAYLFRHVLLRDAAYDLLPPAEKGCLHSWAFESLEALHGRFDSNDGEYRRHPADAFAEVMAEHTRLSGNPTLHDAEVRYTERAGEVARADYRHADALRLWTRHADICAPEQRPHSLHMAALAANRLRGPDAAEPLLLEALDAAAALGDKGQESKIAYSLGGLESARENVERARGMLDRAQQLAKQVGDTRQEGIILVGRGVLAATFGDVAEAREIYREAAAVCATVGNGRTLATIRLNLANLDTLDGRLAEAEEGYRAALAELRAHDDKQGQALVMLNSVDLCVRQRRPNEALAAALQAIELAELSGDRGVAASAKCAAALLTLQSGARPAAEQFWHAGCADLREIGLSVRIEHESRAMRAVCEQLGCTPLGAK